MDEVKVDGKEQGDFRRIVGCLYISDLHDSGRFEQVKRAVSEIEPDHYSDREWQEAFEYVAGKKIENVTEAQVRSLFEKL